MQLNRRRNWAVAAGSIAGLIACNSVGSFDISGGSAGFGGETATGGPEHPGGQTGLSLLACPLAQPTTETACANASAEKCEYGPFADPSCNAYATCATGGWQITEPTACPLDCPAHFDDRAPGEACSDSEVCTYLEATCGCAGANPPLGTADAGDDASADDDGGDAATPDPDGGTPDSGNPVGHWQCVRPQTSGCPARRPLAGSRCVAAVTCDYGSCIFGVQLNYQCVDSTWMQVPIWTCP